MATILEQARADEADELLKSFDWDAMERLHRKGLISDPVSKAKSVMLTDTGLRRAEAAFRRLFEADQ